MHGRTAIAAFVSSFMLACMPYGFAGGGLPSHVKSIAVIPFDNQTSTPDLQRELSDSLRAKLGNRLGLRQAPQNTASAVVRGTIVRYEPDIAVGYTASRNTPTTARRMLRMTVDVELVDQVTGKTLWARKGLLAEGQYDERAEALGRARAIDRIVNDIVEGAQSQW